MSKKLMRLLAIVLALAVVASACGSDSADDVADTVSDAVDDATDAAEDAVDDATDAAEDAVDDATDAAEDAIDDATDAAEDAVDDATDAAEDAMDDDAMDEDDAGATASSIEELEAEWAANRADLVAKIKAEGWGVDGDTLTGPGGWTVDLSACPDDWSDTQGIEDGTLKLGMSIALSGALAIYGNIAQGMDTYFNYVNESGGIGPDGLQIELITKDDAYVATQTQEVIAEMLQTEKPFYITTLGSPNTFAVQSTLNEACVPQPFVMTGHQAWGDPVGHPWTSGMQLSYATEALLWGAWIEQNFDEPVTVAALVMDNDFGLAYEKAFEAFAEDSDIVNVEFVRHDPAAATLTNEMTTLAAASPEVFIAMTAGNPCVLAIQEAERSGITETAVTFMPSVCKAVSDVMLPAGAGSDGWLIFGGGIKDNNDPQYADDPFISWANEQMAAAGLDGNSNNSNGFASFGWPTIEALKIAAELDGGLTRTNYMIAVRAFSAEHPLLLDGISFEMNGPEDSYFIEGSDLSVFSYEDETWSPAGALIDLNGESPNCPWVPGEGC